MAGGRILDYVETTPGRWVGLQDLSREEAVAGIARLLATPQGVIGPAAKDWDTRVYDGFLSVGECADLIRLFEQQAAHHEALANPGFRFTQLHLDAVVPNYTESKFAHFLSAARRYQADVGAERDWPAQFSIEKFRMKRYEPGGADAFGPHVDVGNYATARRFLVMFVYLNAVEEGGETVMLHSGRAVAPVAGRLLCFPPYYRHEGRAPLKQRKYLLQTYLHFRD